MELAVLWIIFAVIVALVANSRQRNAIGWFLLACVISPLLAFILLVAMPSQRGGGGPSWMEVREGKAKRCPFCAEFIQPKAIVCKHCGRDLLPNVQPSNS